MRRRIIALAFALLLVSLTSSAAQTDPCRDRTLSTITIAPGGGTVGEGDLRASLDGKALEVSAIRPDDSGHRIVLLLDTSGSILRESSVWSSYLALARNFVADLPPLTSVEIAIFAAALDVVTPFTDDRQILQKSLADLQRNPALSPQQQRPTALNDSLVGATKLLSPRQDGDLIVVLTDGGDDVSNLTREQAGKAVRASGIPVDSISVADEPKERYRGTTWDFQKIVAKSGGTGIVITGDLLVEAGWLADKKGNPTRRGQAWMELPHMQPRLALMQMDFGKETAKESELRLRGLGPQRIEIDYRVAISACTAAGISGNALH